MSRNQPEAKDSKLSATDLVPVFAVGQPLGTMPLRTISAHDARRLVNANLAGWCNRTSAIRMLKEMPRKAA